MNKVSKLRAVPAKTPPYVANTQAPVTFDQDPINILIVDDEPKNLTVLEAVLDDPGYRLVRAETAEQALLALVVEEFALLILDIRMPGMTGFELAQMIKERKKTAGVPIIFLTAYFNEDQHVLAGYDTGAVDYLHKPVNPAILRSKVAVFAELYRKSRECSLANRALLAEVLQRRRAEEQLRDLNVTLEQRVSERTQALTTAAEALNRSEAKFRMLLDSAPDAMVVVDQRGVIVVTSAQTERLFGYPSDELLMPARSRVRHQGHRANFLQAPGMRGMGVRLELLGLRKDGSEFPIEVSLSPMVFEQETLVSSAIRDISQRKRDEAELNAALVGAEKANQAKSEFLSNMSHELRTPLNAILGFAQLLDSSSPPPTNVQMDRIERITKAGWYLLELIEEILDLSGIESGKLGLSIAPVSLATVMHECQSMVQMQAQTRGVGLVFPKFEAETFVEGDLTRVKQILINLVTNAIKYNNAGGTVAVDCIALTTGRLRILVKDNGPGLNAEKLAHLFEPFNRLGQEAGVVKGTGIGLVICKRLVEMMGGVMGVESTVGEGSVFWFELRLTTNP